MNAINPEYGDMFEEILNNDVRQTNVYINESFEYDSLKKEYYTTNEYRWYGDYEEKVRDETGNVIRDENGISQTKPFDRMFTFRKPESNLTKHKNRMSMLYNDYLAQGDGSINSMNTVQHVLHHANRISMDEKNRADLPDWIKNSPVHTSFINQYNRFNRVAKHDGFNPGDILKANVTMFQKSFNKYLKDNPEAGEEFVNNVREERMKQANARKGAAEEYSQDEQEYQM